MKFLFLTVITVIIMFAGTFGCNNAGAIVSSEDALFTDTIEMGDMQLEREVRLALAKDASLAGLHIAVMAQQGDVSLSGLVNTQYQRDQALHVALEIDGVASVSNRLVIKKQY